jgi:hypothetical protein
VARKSMSAELSSAPPIAMKLYCTLAAVLHWLVFNELVRGESNKYLSPIPSLPTRPSTICSYFGQLCVHSEPCLIATRDKLFLFGAATSAINRVFTTAKCSQCNLLIALRVCA